MIARFGEHEHIDVDSIKAMRWVGEHGVVVIDHQKITIKDKESFKRLEDAFLWRWVNSVYDFRDRNVDYGEKIDTRLKTLNNGGN